MTLPQLNGLGVLVTRPVDQATALTDAITAAGGHAVPFPTLEIQPRSKDAISADAETLDDADMVIFVSPNAVTWGIDYAHDAKIAAVGPSTAQAIRDAGREVDIQSLDGFDSEHLLATDALSDVSGLVVRIVRGQSGRELLADTLRVRGATIDYLAVYERKMPHYDEDALDRIALAWSTGQIQATLALSVETLTNLIALTPDPAIDALASTPLVTPAERVIIEATKQFPTIPVVRAASPQSDDLILALASLNS